MSSSSSGIIGIGGGIFIIALFLLSAFVLFLIFRFAIDKSTLKREMNEVKSELKEIRKLLDKKSN